MRRSALHAFAIAVLLIPGGAFAQGEPPTQEPAVLAKNRKAAAQFEAFPTSHRREYIEWIVEAKRDETKSRRVAQAIEWIAEGKGRNWKYQ